MTTETKHTPEPWRIECDAADRNVIRGGAEEKPTTVIVVDSWVKEANARRIVAAVNACAGIATETLEREGEFVRAKSYTLMQNEYS